MAFHLSGKGQAYHQLPHPPRHVLGQASGPPQEPAWAVSGGIGSGGGSGDGSGGGGAEQEGPDPGPGQLHHLGMAQLAPDGGSLQFYHRLGPHGRPRERGCGRATMASLDGGTSVACKLAV